MSLGPFDLVTHDGTDFTAKKLNEKIESLVRTFVSIIDEVENNFGIFGKPGMQVFLEHWKKVND